MEAFYLQRTRFELVVERKLRRRQLTETGDVEITGRDMRDKTPPVGLGSLFETGGERRAYGCVAIGPWAARNPILRSAQRPRLVCGRENRRFLSGTGDLRDTIGDRAYRPRPTVCYCSSTGPGSPASRLIGTPRKRTISAREVCHGPSGERHRSAAERRGANARVWRSGARPRWQDVATAQDCRSTPAVARRRP